MPTKSETELAATTDVFDRRQLHALGVLIPIELHPLSFLPGRHPLGRPGDGLRFLRTREFEPGEDNPRDVDRFSPPGELWVNEWEAESRASIRLLADFSASMAYPAKAEVQRRLILQLTYSLWRAGERLTVSFFGDRIHAEVRKRNLPAQLQALLRHLASAPNLPGTDIAGVLQSCARDRHAARDDLIFVSSDFLTMTVTQWRSAIAQWRYKVIPVVITFELSEEMIGLTKMWDPERRSHRLTLLSRARIRRINQEERARVEELGRLFRSTGLDYIVLSRERDVYMQLVRLARSRRQRSNR
jgi:uncharacterized protein (DUF58 family)